MKVFVYKNCSTCQKALKYLDRQNVKIEIIDIIANPPSVQQLTKMLGYLSTRGHTFKNLFNTSGQVYRELKISDKLKAGLTESEALNLLAKNGKLIKRPFLLTDKNGAVGFQEDLWKDLLK